MEGLNRRSASALAIASIGLGLAALFACEQPPPVGPDGNLRTVATNLAPPGDWEEIGSAEGGVQAPITAGPGPFIRRFFAIETDYREACKEVSAAFPSCRVRLNEGAGCSCRWGVSRAGTATNDPPAFWIHVIVRDGTHAQRTLTERQCEAERKRTDELPSGRLDLLPACFIEPGGALGELHVRVPG